MIYPDMQPNVVDWFDPYDPAHLEAYRYLQKTGLWPADFLPRGLAFPALWQSTIQARLAHCYVTHVLGDVPDGD